MLTSTQVSHIVRSHKTTPRRRLHLRTVFRLALTPKCGGYADAQERAKVQINSNLLSTYYMSGTVLILRGQTSIVPVIKNLSRLTKSPPRTCLCGTPWPGGHGPVPGENRHHLHLRAPSSMPVRKFSVKSRHRGRRGGQELGHPAQAGGGAEAAGPTPHPMQNIIKESGEPTVAGADEPHLDKPGGSPHLHPYQEIQPGRLVPRDGQLGIKRAVPAPVAQRASDCTGRRGPSPTGVEDPKLEVSAREELKQRAATGRYGPGIG